MAAASAASASPSVLIVTGRRTPQLLTRLQQSYAETREILFSDNRYNAKKEPAQFRALVPQGRYYDVPAYDLSVKLALVQLFDLPRLQAAARFWRVPLPQLKFSPEWIREPKRLAKIQTTIDLVKAQGYVEAADRLQRVFDAFRGLGDRTFATFSEWNQFLMSQGLPVDWSSRTDYSTLMTLFGVDAAQAAQLTADTVQREDTYRYVAKMLNCYTFDGCPTDVVNVIFMLKGIPPIDKNERDAAGQLVWTSDRIAGVILGFAVDLIIEPAPVASTLTLIMDAEYDDRLVHVLLYALNPTLKVETQLPPFEASLAPLLQFYLEHGVTVWHDEECDNAKAIAAVPLASAE